MKIENWKYITTFGVKIADFIKANWLIVTILVVGTFLRLYKISSYMTFLGDEGRDVIIVRNLLVHADPILIGPGTSVGEMYLGPLYYYFMAPFLWLSSFSPIGPAVGVALLGVATIYLVYLVGFEFFSKKAGLISAGLYAIAPTVITYSRSSWNPNIMPFFSLLSIYSIWKLYESHEASREVGWWLVVTAISFAFVLQSHYLGILLFPVLFLFYILSFLKIRKLNGNWKLEIGNYLKKSVFAVLIFGFLMSPLLIFDIRHNFLNSKAFYKFLTVREETVISVNPLSAVSRSYPIYEQINSSLLAAKNNTYGKYVSILITVMVIWLILNRKKDILHTTYYILLQWLGFGLIGLSFYSQSIHDHYFGFLFPVPFLLIGLIIQKTYDSKYKFISVLILGVLVFLNLLNNPLKNNPNNQMQRAQNVSAKVLEIANNKPFNLAVLAERNYEDGYRYFMEVAGAQVMHADRWDQKTIVDTLMVICEKPDKECDPTHSPKAEVANFGWSKIDGQWEVDGVIIYKLVHSKP